MKSSAADGSAQGAKPVSPPAVVAPSLTDLMRQRTHPLHARAERSGIVNDVLRGKASRYGYALFMRNLLPAYSQLEAALEAGRDAPVLRAIARRELYRAPALRADLGQMFGATWEHALPLLNVGKQYGQRVADAARGAGAGLIAHAYTRYFGDLSGGQVMKQLLGRTPGLKPQELTFFDFSDISDNDDFKRDYRRALDDSATMITDIDAVVAEAVVAFELNIAVAEGVQTAILTAV
jgi:heme oxygenase (biliverdin-producing, ferredoxin)